MQFIYPELLWALGLLSIPVIIHLFFFRRFKKVYFSNVRFLKEIKQETSSRNKIKNLLILLMRILAIAALIFAFAQPFLSNNENVKSGTKGVSIYIDNSFSMSAESAEESILKKAKKKAVEISEAYGESDKIQILTSDFEGKHQRFLNKEEARTFIDEVKSSPSARNISAVVNRAKQAMKSESFDNKIIYIISDFQKSITDEFEIDTNYSINLIPLQAIKESNVSIDSAYLESGSAILNQANIVKVIIKNHSAEKAENIRLSLLNNGQDKPVGSYDLEGTESISVDATFTPTKTGWQEGILKITDYPIVFDDTYNFSFYVNEEVNILALNQTGNNKYLTAAFENIPYFKFANMPINQIKYDEFSEKDLIILNDLKNFSSGLINELKTYVENGGNILIFPDPNGEKTSYNNLLASLKSSQLQELTQIKKEVKSINTKEFVFDGVFENRQVSNIKLPVTNAQFTLSNYQQSLKTTLLNYRDGADFMIKTKLDKGFVYLCAAPLDISKSDLVNNAEIFVPMVYKMALSNADGGKIAYTIGKDMVLNTEVTRKTAEDNFSFSGPIQFIPGQFNNGNRTLLEVGNQIKEAGFYTLSLDNKTQAIYAFNYDNKESELDYYSTEDLKETFGESLTIYNDTAEANFTQLINENESGISLWRWCLIACLIFLLIEQLLIRFLKN